MVSDYKIIFLNVKIEISSFCTDDFSEINSITVTDFVGDAAKFIKISHPWMRDKNLKEIQKIHDTVIIERIILFPLTQINTWLKEILFKNFMTQFVIYRLSI
jgi:hypothetical protein